VFELKREKSLCALALQRGIEMKRVILFAAVLAASIGSALAADLPSMKAPPPVFVPPPPLWTGGYIGLNAGGTWTGDSSVTTFGTPGYSNPLIGGGAIGATPLSAALAAGSAISVNNGGFIGGGQAGYNYQFYGSLVVGAEADIQGLAGQSSVGTALGSSGSIAGFPASAVASSALASRSLDYLGTVRGRLGYLITPTLLIYGTGGFAYGGANANFSIVEAITGPCFCGAPAFGAASYSTARTGWTAGGGVEWMFLPNWSAKVEYLYYDLGSTTLNSTGTGLNAANTPFWGASYTTATRFNGNIVRAGVNWHWEGPAPAPIVAKY
jgi:outer membrane immunogenic protein